MASIIGVGDNTVDRYLDRNLMFPGGNAVNVPVFFKRLSGSAGYLGWLGDDPRGALVLNSLKAEGVDVSHCRVIDEPTGRCDIELHDGDRVFIGSMPGARKMIHLEETDYEYISKHAITHTSIYSFIENQLPELKQASNLLSFDFSSNWSREYLEKTLPHVDVAFLSAPQLNESELERLVGWIYAKSHALVVVTRGEKGSTAYDGEVILNQGVIETQIVDTLGAGDSYISRILYETSRGTELKEAMYRAAVSAADTCRYFGAWCYGVPIEES
ncbi:fructoselysine kinase [Candidatus Bathyarchaeota archaeon]|nr:MAG: fructoselysine kinase [Candidatus Bathyarchaeota archaeon]